MKVSVALVLLVFATGGALAAPPFDIVYLLDESGSLDATEFSQEKNYILQSTNSLLFGSNDVAASLVVFASTPRLGVNLTPTKSSFIAGVAFANQLGGASDFTAALTAAKNQFTNFGRVGAHQIIVAVGDGPDSVNPAAVGPKLNELAALGIHVFSILAAESDTAFMQSLVRNDGQSFEITSSPQALSNAIVSIANTISGDYNVNGKVDAADYVLWRDKNGQSLSLPNDTTPGSIVAADYDAWRANFGKTAASGAALVAVPEPSTGLLTIAALTALSCNTSSMLQRRSRRTRLD